ncbi:hypothetical protein [Sphingomonas sp. R86521]
MAARLDGTDHVIDEEFGAQVVEQVITGMAAIQASVMKLTKHDGSADE